MATIAMNSLHSSMSPFLFFLLFSIPSWVTSADQAHEGFLQCLSRYHGNANSISKVIQTPLSNKYSSLWESYFSNLRFKAESRAKPQVIVTPLNASHIQSAIACSKKHGMQIRVRSGGHDYEGLSYVSDPPFVIIDLVNHRKVFVNVKDKTAWVQAGATLAEVYFGIAEKSKTLAFPAGVCPTVGVGGHFSGGGQGMMMRKYGLAADHIIDAQLIDVRGRILDRKSMGEDLFWAIRGGGGNTFGVVIAWKLSLVPVPPTVTVFNVSRTLEQNATNLVHQWQYAVEKFHEDLFSRIFLTTVDSSHKRRTTILASFTSLFLGGVDRLIPMMQESFPQLGLTKEDCIEMSWIESVPYFAFFPTNTSLDVLLNTSSDSSSYFKGKSDFVEKPLPESAIKGIWKRLFQVDVQMAELQFTAYGGKMNEISESSIPFPHRARNIFLIHYSVNWNEKGIAASKYHLNWIRELYSYMTPYVSKNPRSAYVNYRDLDIGVNNPGNASYEEAMIWGRKYFRNNFDRLVHVKTKVDPSNFFRNLQSVPPLSK